MKKKRRQPWKKSCFLLDMYWIFIKFPNSLHILTTLSSITSSFVDVLKSASTLQLPHCTIIMVYWFIYSIILTTRWHQLTLLHINHRFLFTGFICVVVQPNILFLLFTVKVSGNKYQVTSIKYQLTSIRQQV